MIEKGTYKDSYDWQKIYKFCNKQKLSANKCPKSTRCIKNLSKTK